MFNLWKALVASVCLLTAFSVRADDIDIFTGVSRQVSAPAEIMFAVDNSLSMACGVNQVESGFEGHRQCFLNIHVSDEIAVQISETYEATESKYEMVRDALTGLLADTEVFPADVRVGLATYNGFGGAIVQPLAEMSQATGNSDYPSHRELLQEEAEHFYPSQSTPILGTLLEVGQYLTSSPVLAGTERRYTPADIHDSLDDIWWNPTLLLGLQDLSDEYLTLPIYTFGESARTSHPASTIPDSRTYDVSSACQEAIDADPVMGKFNADCASETLLASEGQVVTYNENINQFDGTCVLGNSEEQSQTTTQVVLITDGLPSQEEMSRTVNNIQLATWVKRFVTGDQEATGVLAADEAFADTDPVFPEEATDMGCPSDASTASNAAGYESCLYNLANRFRELGVRIHVIGFALGDELDGEEICNPNQNMSGVNNTMLCQITEITGGTFLATHDAAKMKEFIKGLTGDAVAASKIEAPVLSPSVAANPGAILANSSEVFFPMFKPSDRAYYYGNLKKYRIKKATKQIDENTTQTIPVIVDADGESVIEPCDENDPEDTRLCFKDSTRSLWSIKSDADEAGNIITKGGAAEAQDIYGRYPDGERRVYVQTGAPGDSLELLNLVAVNAGDESLSGPDTNALLIDDANPATVAYFNQVMTLLDPSQETLGYSLLRWLVGYDEPRFGANGFFDAALVESDAAFTEREILAQALSASPSRDLVPELKQNSTDIASLERSRLYYGALIHSSPRVVNYGVDYDEDTGTFTYDNSIIVSGNDGFLRIIDTETGEEYSSFYPKTLLKNLPAMYQMSPGKMRYGLDSSWAVWRQDLPDPDNELLMDAKIGPGSDGNGFVRAYGGMRRGGRSYYFLDVTNRHEPELLAEINGDAPGTDFPEMGQTWSEPTLIRVQLPNKSLPSAMLVFGGGYDPDYDFDEPGEASGACADVPGSGIDDPAQNIRCGNQIYMVGAGGYGSNDDMGEPGFDELGELIWWASDDNEANVVVSNMKHSIPAKIKAIDKDDDGLTDRLYVGDMGGQVFRVSINNNASSMSEFASVTTLIQVGEEGVGGDSRDNRVFFEEPSVAVMRNNNVKYIGIALASGWREKPMDKSVEDEIYFIRDNYEDNWETLQRPGESGGTATFLTGIESFSGTKAEYDSAKVVAMSLAGEGEKAFGGPVILRGNVFVTSYLPPSDSEILESQTSCDLPQRGKVSWFNAQTDAPRFAVINNDGVVSEATVDEVVVTQTLTTPGVSLSGPGVHISDDSVTLLAGTQAISVPLGSENIKKTEWLHLQSGKDLLEQLAVTE